MGSRGPVPKRSEHSRSHRSKAEQALVQKSSAPVAPVVQPPAEDGWHSMAADWYRSLAESGQARFYEASDWQTARIWAEILTRQLNGRPSAQMIAAWGGVCTELLTTEGARRRAKLELQRAEVDEDEDASIVALDKYRAALEA